MLNAQQVTHHFDSVLFEDVTINLLSGESLAIIGKSGSGKSTLMYILSTFLRPISGKVEIFGSDIYSLSSKELVSLRRDSVGMIFQSHYLFKGFSAKENLMISSLITNKDIDNEILKTLDIDFVMDKKITKLSGGQQQRVSIARVLMKKPKILFADEPTGNLDKDNASNVMDSLFLYTRGGGSLLLITHDKDNAFRCDNVYELNNLSLNKLK